MNDRWYANLSQWISNAMSASWITYISVYVHRRSSTLYVQPLGAGNESDANERLTSYVFTLVFLNDLGRVSG